MCERKNARIRPRVPENKECGEYEKI